MRVALAALALLAVSVSGQSIPPARPPPSKRTFNSTAVNALIDDYSARMRDPDLATLFSNCLPNTLDTTVQSFDLNPDSPDAFIITGDISAAWLRDSMNQALPYIALAPQDPALSTLLCGLAHRQWRDVLHDPYANAFNFAEEGGPHQDDARKPPMTPHVFEGKYELDSLCSTLKLSTRYWNATANAQCFNTTDFVDAMELIVSVITQSQNGSASTPDAEPYLFQRLTLQATDTQMMSGQGVPAAGNGMARCNFRNSDDVVTLPYNTANNMMAVVELRALAAALPSVAQALGLAPDSPTRARMQQLATNAQALSGQIDAAIQRHARTVPAAALRRFEERVKAARGNAHDIAAAAEELAASDIYAYEIDGFGSAYVMDDAGVPSLLGAPYIGYTTRDDPLYRRTRAHSLSAANPYFFSGACGEGTGGPHVGLGHIWPMGIISRAITSTDDNEILWALDTLKASSAGTGFLHESYWKNDYSDYTRKWFAWCNGFFGQLILQLAQERPHLIFKSS